MKVINQYKDTKIDAIYQVECALLHISTNSHQDSRVWNIVCSIDS